MLNIPISGIVLDEYFWIVGRIANLEGETEIRLLVFIKSVVSKYFMFSANLR